MPPHFNTKSKPTGPIHTIKSVESLQQGLHELAEHIRTATKPPVAEIEKALQTHLSSKSLPANTSIPSAKDKRAVQLALSSALVLKSCESYFIMGTGDTLHPSLVKAWPGIWRWLQFLDENCCQDVKFGDELKAEALTAIPSILEIMSWSETVQRQVISTPAVCEMKKRYARGMQELPGAGRAFAAVQAETLKTSKDSAVHTIELLNFLLVEQSFDFEAVDKCIPSLSDLTKSLFSLPKSCGRAMLDQGLVPSIVKALFWLEKHHPARLAEENSARKCVFMCLETLDASLRGSGIPWINQALDTGLLRAILEPALRKAHGVQPITDLCTNILNTISQQLVYKSVVRSAAKALGKMDHEGAYAYSENPIWKTWSQFKELVQKRNALKQTMESYCSKECQKMDWPTHKSWCKEDQRIIREAGCTPLTPGETNFMGLIVRDDVQMNPEAFKAFFIACQGHPASELAFSLDYTQVPVCISVVPLHTLRSRSQFQNDSDFIADVVQRHSRSDETMVAEAVTLRGDMMSCGVFGIPTPRLVMLPV
ncbi:hypothetical protein HWV62_12016 [Athelia sp. TMB]|nr:hypothetical protein HWV62_12016 [Athelia sp. TMB]